MGISPSILVAVCAIGTGTFPSKPQVSTTERKSRLGTTKVTLVDRRCRCGDILADKK